MIVKTQYLEIQSKLPKYFLLKNNLIKIRLLKVCAPSLIYNLQNNLYYVALSNLESTTFCVIYQLKILTTAIMLRILLGKLISRIQWIALLILVLGVAIVQSQYEPPASQSSKEQSFFVGMLSVLTMCISSAFAGKFGRKFMLKKSARTIALLFPVL
ncbi:unnamed protein product [Meloidogyne enterolobii]|uniref:Uncharacterized protein n=1 Tax=Meloidogyne enterolobii TaxID=390850 RepID=A0ACB1AYR1_MELEN